MPATFAHADPKEMFPQIVDRMARERPDTRFVSSIGEGALSWRELDRAGMQWAARFIALDVGHGEVVVNLFEAGLQSLCAWLGLARVGGVDASINTEFRGRILAYAINNTGAKLLLLQKEFLAILEEVADDLEHVQTVVLTDGQVPRSTSIRARLVSLNDLPADADSSHERIRKLRWWDLACVTYTSGTTGPSKAVMLPWAQMHCINLGTFPIDDLGPRDVIYSLSPNAHFGSKAQPYLAAMIGGQVVIRRRFSATDFWNDVAAYGITTAGIVGPMAELLMRSPLGPGPDTSLRNIFMAPVIPNYRDFNERFGTRLCTAYNSTEGAIALHSRHWNPDDHRSCGQLREGYPGFEVRLVDENDVEVPNGEVGEAIIRSSVPWTMNAGYLNNRDATARAWRNGWFHTGDGFRRSPEGRYYFVDRMKDAIRRRGENISSYEVETDVMVNSSVLECAAVAVPADDGEQEILLFVVAKPGSGLTPESLCRDLVSRVTRFMVPRFIEFVDALPRTDATRRVKKAELRQRGLGPRTWDRITAGLVAP